MNKKPLIGGLLSMVVTQPVCALSTGDLLAFTPGTVASYDSYGNPVGVTGGSWFAFDLNGNGSVNLANEAYAMSVGPDGGVLMGVAQLASGSHSGPPDGTESPRIDAPTRFFGNTGMHGNGAPVSITSELGTTKLLDFGGWHYIWNRIEPATPSVGFWLGGDAAQGDTGLATLVCATAACAAGDSFTLDYSAHIPIGEPTCCGGLQYVLHLEGIVVSAVPVPAAAWLLGSGLLTLLSVTKRGRFS